MTTTILIVDDEANLRKTLAEILAARGYNILQADDGTSAVELLRKNTPDLIFSDWKMPRMGGEEFLQYLHSHAHLTAIPVIVITAYGSSHSAIEAVRLGAYDFITKPFDLDEIVVTAERALDHSSRIGKSFVCTLQPALATSRAPAAWLAPVVRCWTFLS